MQVTLLGRFGIAARGRVVSEWPRPSARRLCELVLVSPGRRVSRDLACEELFRASSRARPPGRCPRRFDGPRALTELGPDGAALLSADLLHIWASPDVAVDAGTRSAALRAGLAIPPGSSATTRFPPPSPRTGSCWRTSRTPSRRSAFTSDFKTLCPGGTAGAAQ